MGTTAVPAATTSAALPAALPARTPLPGAASRMHQALGVAGGAVEGSLAVGLGGESAQFAARAADPKFAFLRPDKASGWRILGGVGVGTINERRRLWGGRGACCHPLSANPTSRSASYNPPYTLIHAHPTPSLSQIRDAHGRRPSDPAYDPRTLAIPAGWFKEHKVADGQRQWWEFKSKHFDSGEGEDWGAQHPRTHPLLTLRLCVLVCYSHPLYVFTSNVIVLSNQPPPHPQQSCCSRWVASMRCLRWTRTWGWRCWGCST